MRNVDEWYFQIFLLFRGFLSIENLWGEFFKHIDSQLFWGIARKMLLLCS